MAAVTEKEGGVRKAMVCGVEVELDEDWMTKAAVCWPEEDCVQKAVGAPEEAVLPAPEKEKRGKCNKKTVGEEATFLETAKDFFTQFKDTPAKTHWIRLMNGVRAAGQYVSKKSSSVFGKHKVEPVVKDNPAQP